MCKYLRRRVIIGIRIGISKRRNHMFNNLRHSKST
eukprot:COSAG01_NODE_35278_length_534_cov_1.188506_2_plen_35_part_01